MPFEPPIEPLRQPPDGVAAYDEALLIDGTFWQCAKCDFLMRYRYVIHAGPQNVLTVCVGCGEVAKYHVRQVPKHGPRSHRGTMPPGLKGQAFGKELYSTATSDVERYDAYRARRRRNNSR